MFGAAVSALAIDPATPTTLYAGTYDRVVKSIDGGLSWAHSYSGNAITRVVLDPATPSTLYLASGDGIFKSIDAGNSWTPANNGLTSLYVLDLVSIRAPATLYAGTSSGGVFKSVDAGGSGFPPVMDSRTYRYPALSRSRRLLDDHAELLVEYQSQCRWSLGAASTGWMDSPCSAWRSTAQVHRRSTPGRHTTRCSSLRMQVPPVMANVGLAAVDVRVLRLIQRPRKDLRWGSRRDLQVSTPAEVGPLPK
jgi:hypothetical protein